MVFLATLISNGLFIVLRTCMRHKIQLDQIPERKQLPGVDTIIAIQEVVNAFNAQVIPLIVSCFLFFQSNDTNSGQLFWQLELILFSNIIAAFCITFLIFVHWKKGSEMWLKISYIVFYVLLLTNYVILPMVNVLISVFFMVWPGIDLKE